MPDLPPLASLFRAEPPLAMMRWPHYVPIYERHFGRLRARPVRMLEIGIQGGASQVMWRRYFHPQSVIVGIDVDPACAALPTGTEIRIGDQADPAFLDGLIGAFGPFDIVLDDGGHRASQQIASFERLYPTMAPDGLYVIEDTHTALWQGSAYTDRLDGLTILDVAHACTRRLMDWTGTAANFYTLLSDQHRRLDAAAGAFCRSTGSIHFYDSVIVFEREARHAPRQVQLPAP